MAAPHRVEVRDVELPRLGLSDVLVEVECSGISAGTELRFFRGDVDPQTPVDTSLAGMQEPLRYPMVYGYSAVGRVVEAGPSASDWVGKRVFAFAPHQRHVVVPVSQVVALPDSLGFETACLLANMETAVSLVMDAVPMLGEAALVVGQGVVGQLVAGLLSAMPLSRVDCIEPSAFRRQLAQSFSGVTQAGVGSEYDVAIEVSGHGEALAQTLERMRFEGRVIVGSWYSSPTGWTTRAHRNRNTVTFSQVSHIDGKWAARFTKARRMQVALKWLEKLHVERLITHRFALADASHAYAALDNHRGDVMQVLLSYP